MQRSGKTHVLMSAEQGEAPTDKVVQAAWRLVDELGQRTRRTDEEVQAYREMLRTFAERAGVNVPDLGAEDGAVDMGKLRNWLDQLLSVPPQLSALSVSEERRGGGSQPRGRGGSGRRARG